MTEEIQALRQGGFWRRGVALFIDALIVSVVVSILGISLSLFTDGRIRVGGTTYNKVECYELDRSYPEIKLPEDFKPTSAARCTRSILGYQFDWFLFVQQKSQNEMYGYEKNLVFALDRKGNSTRAFYLDGLLILLIVASIFVQELKSGDTSGKRSMRLRVQSLGGSPPGRKQVAIRLLRFGYLAPLVAVYAASELVGQENLPFLFKAIALSVALAIATLVEFIWSTRGGRPPFYDRWAGTEVVKTGAQVLAGPRAGNG